MPTLGICGDSYMSATVNGDRSDIKDSEGKHFTEILAKKLNFDYFTLARSACSNIAIRLQIDEMIKQNVDLVLIGTTTPARIEIPHHNRQFNKNLGVYNLDYSSKFYPDLSCKNKSFQNNIVTETITNIFDNDKPLYEKVINMATTKARPFIDENHLTAIKYYINFLFDVELKNQIDMWVIHSGVTLLEKHNVPFMIYFNSPESGILNCRKNEDPRFLFSDSKLNPWNHSNVSTRRWHTTDESQVELAELWFNYIKEHSIIKDI